MRELSNTELKEVSLSILRYIDKICRANNVKYFIGFGTLLGAVRHKGFIPWDDDIDICILRPDYHRFLKIMEKDNHIRLICMENDPNYYFSFARICDKRTVILNRPLRKIKDFGVWVDVFPIDNAPEKNERQTWYQEYLKRRRKMMLTIPTEYESVKISKFLHKSTLKNYIDRFRLGVKNFSKYRQDFHEWITQFNNNETDDVFIASTPYKMKTCFPKDLFTDFSELDFECLKVCAPVDYDRYLTMIYGDYMKLPPEEERKSQHYFRAYWKE